MFGMSSVRLYVLSKMPGSSERTVASSKTTRVHLFFALMDVLVLSQMRLKFESTLTLGECTLVGSYVDLRRINDFYCDLRDF